ncbi:sodium-independent sulfate anion transporter isoform X2 [Dendroctonus ponderosae]|uniref:STAS domain-containing protein n=1 Tax=Dendroctonus ponderosae TaxID=77166 RepID=A0AAR5PE25_DENPD|nr:sodium-independent sulfate anion transporter isoform X2 [Dendroctonus ponderosae]
MSSSPMDEPSPRRIDSAIIKKIVSNRFPIISWLPSYTIYLFFQDLLAGFTVGLTEIPQGIAYAIVAGLPSQYGLYSAIMGGFIYCIFGGCKDINVGPTAIMALIVQSSVTTMGPSGAILITFLSGIIIFMAGVLRLGFLVQFFSFPVISGFTTAAALSIASTQLKQLLGISGPASIFLDAWISLFKNIKETRKWDAILGFMTIFIVFAFREIKKYGSLKHKPEWSRNRNLLGNFLFIFSLAGNAVVVIGGTSIAYVAHNSYNATPFILTGDVAGGLPDLSLPPFSVTWNGTYYSFSAMLSEYGSTLAFCPIIAFLEHIAIVKAFSKGKIIDATQELMALGLSNIAGSLVQSMPVTGSFTRTAVNNASGARTTIAGVITSCMLLVALVLLTGAFKYIPKATLAGVIVVAMYYLCEFDAIPIMWRTKRLDLIPFFTTLMCCLLISLEYGIIIGIGINLTFILYDAARPKLYVERLMLQERIIYVIRPKASLYFTSAEFLREKMLKDCGESESLIVIDGEFVPSVDATVARGFFNLLQDLELRHQTVLFWNFNQTVTDICSGEHKKLGCFFRNGTLESVINDISKQSAIETTARNSDVQA